MSTEPNMGRSAHLPGALTRRDLLFRAGCGLGGLALSCLLAEDAAVAHRLAPGPRGAALNPLAARPPHSRARARSVIFLFMTGGPSQVETFDPKPVLDRLHGEKLPESYGVIKSQFTDGRMKLLGSAWKFRPHGQSGIEVSELFPCVAECVDDMAVIRSCHADSFIHAPAMYQMVTGRTAQGHPSLGSWVAYGLGSASENLPAFCVLPQPEGLPEGGAPMWGPGYLPASYQGTLLRNGPTPILNLAPPSGMTRPEQRRMLDYVRELNDSALTADGTDLAARIAAHELAFRMQQHAPEAVDLQQETAETRTLYGLDDPVTEDFGTRCLLARRLVERGVRFVQVFSGGGPASMQWDAHDNMVVNHSKMCRLVDRPIAGLLRDLKRRGLLDETLVIWGSEFGRTPISQNGKGRDHNPSGFTMWMAGGGVRGGTVVGATDEIGYRSVQDPVHVRDIHATILHLLGLDHLRLTHLHNGRHERLTDFAGQVIQKLL